jgi:hypothetical protein
MLRRLISSPSQAVTQEEAERAMVVPVISLVIKIKK